MSVKRTSVVDFGRTPRHANNFLERMGIIPTIRNNAPRIAPGAMRVHNLPLPPSLPRPDDVLFQAGSPPPDRDVADVWPPNQETPS